MHTASDRGLICFSSVAGTMGDVRPLLPLALALRARGFAILFVGDALYEPLAMRAGLKPSEWYSYSQVPQSFWLRTTGGQRWLWGRRLRRRDRELRREIRRHKTERIEACVRMLGGPNTARVVAAIGGIGGFPMIHRFGPRCAKIIATVMPYQPSAEFTLLPPDRSLIERLRHRWHQRAATPEASRPFCEETYHLLSVSPAVFPRPSDWLPNMQVTGFTAIDDERFEWMPPAALERFLAAGPPPVYVGFGSYPLFFGEAGERFARVIVDGCRRRGMRCILHTPDLPESWNSANVLVLDGHVSHRYLLPRCAAVVHHGGYGTLHAALLARRPMATYPIQTDQFFWTARMGELGVGQGFTARLRALTADRLAADLGTILDGRCLANAKRVGRTLVGEDGVPLQATAVESIVDHHQRGHRPIDWQMPRFESASVPLITAASA